MTSDADALERQNAEFGAGWHRQPELVGEGRLAMHGLELPADVISLDGLWQFRYWTGEAPPG